MRKKGFTLIELLAVIVILAIIALIAVPIVLNIIEDTKNSALLRSADFYLDAVELSIAEKVLDSGSIDGEYFIDTNGDICIEENCIEIEVQGQKPTSGKIIIEEGKIKSIYKLTLDGKTISTDSSGNLAIKKYSTYNITYENMNNTSNLPTSVEEGENIVIDLTGKDIPEDKLQVKVNNELITNYTYDGNKLTINNVSGNIEVIKALDTYTVTYENIDNTLGLPEEVIQGSTLTVDFKGKGINKVVVKVNNEVISEYTYEDNVLTINNVNGNIEIAGYKEYIVTYKNISDIDSLPATIIEGNTLTVDFKGKGISKVVVKANNEEISEYTYEDNVLTINNVNGNIEITGYKEYIVTYKNISDIDSLPATIIEGNTLTVDFKGKGINKVVVKVNNSEITNYTFTSNILTLTNVTGNVEITGYYEYSISYTNISNTSGLPTKAIKGEDLIIDLTGKDIPAELLSVKRISTTITDYTYENNILIIPANRVTNNITISKLYEYTVTYSNISDTTGLPTTAIQSKALTIDLTGKDIDAVVVRVGGNDIAYTHSNDVVTVPTDIINGNVEVKETQFSKDTWETIITNVQNGNISNYEVGDKKTITLTGEVAGTYIVRLANKSTDDAVCSNTAYSQTACGFVIEFVDIITTYRMNDTKTNAGGWPASKMRKYVTPVIDETTGELIEGSGTIYNALPEIIRNNIIDTRVVSGYEKNKTENYTSTDKLYLLSTKEIYDLAGYDKVSKETRQLDYYKNAGVTSSTNNSLASKYLGGTAKGWWLRSAYANYFYYFNCVFTAGSRSYDSAYYAHGVAAAFRLG